MMMIMIILSASIITYFVFALLCLRNERRIDAQD